LWDPLKSYAAKSSVNIKAISGKMKELLLERLKALLARYKWRNAGFYQVLNSDDPVIKKSMERILK
jgi:carboxyl-terminal processing protease